MASTLPNNPSLDRLRDEARRLQRGIRAADRQALEIVRRHHPRPEAALVDAPDRFALHDAQLTVARRYGFTGWPALVGYLDIAAELTVDPSGIDEDSLEPADQHWGPMLTGDLHGSQPNATGGRMDEDRFAACQLAAIDQPEVGGLIDQWKRGRLVIIEPRPHGPDRMGRSHGIFGERAAPLVPSARTSPASTLGPMVAMVSNIIWIWPPRISLRAPELPL